MSNFVYVFVLSFAVFAINAQGIEKIEFVEAFELLDQHASVEDLKLKARAQNEKADSAGSWGDPKLTLAARNMPETDLSLDQSPMSGFEVQLSQTVGITPKYRRMAKSNQLLADSISSRAEARRLQLAHKVWSAAIEWQENRGRLEVAQESLQWIENMLSVSKKLYENGGLSQQAILDIQMRRSELSSNILKLKSRLEEIKAQLSYLLPSRYEVNLTEVPWDFFEQTISEELKDPSEIELERFVESQELKLSAERWGQVPDITLGVGHMKRDANAFGDAVTFSVSMPLPTSRKRYAQKKQALAEKRSALHRLADYKSQKSSRLRELSLKNKRIKDQLKILDEETLSFARSSREIAATSYQNGSLNYNDLLDTELKLQKFQDQHHELKGEWRKSRLESMLLSGRSLNPLEERK